MAEVKSVAFSKEECEEILENCFKNDRMRYVSHSFNSLSGDVEGYLAEHYSLKIFYEDGRETNSIKFFVKAILNQKGFLAIFAKGMDVFRKESFIYKNLFVQYETIKNFKPVAPKLYFSKDNVLVLEDLTNKGYQLIERLKFFDTDQCKMVLKTLAHYHAYSVVLEEIKSKETNSVYRLNEEYPLEFEDRIFGQYKISPVIKFIESGVKSIFDLVEEISVDKFPDKDRLQELLGKLYEENDQLSNIENKYRSTTVHGDLWSNNIMFKYENDEIVDCLLVDFQILNYSLPGQDVELFFYGNTTAKFRIEHKNELMQYYYKSFCSVLEDNSIDASTIMSYQDLLDMCILKGPDAKMQAVSDMCLLFLPEELRMQVAKDPNFYKTILVDDRSKYVADMYHREDSDFRNIIVDELIDLKHLLEAREKFLSSHI